MAKLPTPQAAPKAELPGWLQEINDTLVSAEAHVFMLHNNVSDYAPASNQDIADYLGRILSVPFQVVAMYSVSKGIHFPLLMKDGEVTSQSAMRAAFLKIIGMDDDAPDQPLMIAPEPAVMYLLEFLKKAPKGAVIIDRLDNIVGDIVNTDQALINTMERLHDAGTDKVLESKGNPLIMLAPNLEEIRPQVRRASAGIKYIEIALPDYEARLDFIRLRSAATDMAMVKFVDLTQEQLAGLTASLMRRHIENILLRAKKENGNLTRALAMKAQRELMDVEFAGLVKRIDKPFRLEHVGGHKEAKAYAQKRLLDVEHAPSAILWVGPPGTGKTMIANAIANESGMNCLEVDLSQLMGGIVGETEKNVARFRRAVEANAPCHVFMDEIDQKIRRGEGGPDSGGGGSVENRLFSAILEITGDATLKGRVVWHFASNRPDLLDEAFLSRMGAVIPLLPAETDEQRADVLWRILSRLNANKLAVPGADALVTLAGRMKDWSGRDMEHIASEALSNAQIDHTPVMDALEEAITYRRADTASVAKQVKEALKACKDLRLIPEHHRAELQAKPAASGDWTQQGGDGFSKTTRKIASWGDN